MRLGITWEGLREFIAELRAKGPEHEPAALLVSEFDKIELKEELIRTAKVLKMEPQDYSKNYKNQIAFLDGVIIASHPHVGRGQLRLIPKFKPAEQSRHIIVPT